MLMLCLVFAVAGPVMPGAGDVSPMDPTIAYGAAPTMLVFAPDGGAGFDLMGQDSFDQILISWNTTIAGPLGTSGAQNVIPPIPKGPMAVRATPWGRNGGVFDHRLLHKCNNSTSGTRAATEVTDAWVKPENCATNTGLNNRQEDEKTGTWRWVVLPTIVVVTHLGDLHTMRRWFGGSGYGISINRYLWASFILLTCLPTTAAVTCRTCFDQIQGCTGGDDCPFVATTWQNVRVQCVQEGRVQKCKTRVDPAERVRISRVRGAASGREARRSEFGGGAAHRNRDARHSCDFSSWPCVHDPTLTQQCRYPVAAGSSASEVSGEAGAARVRAALPASRASTFAFAGVASRAEQRWS